MVALAFIAGGICLLIAAAALACSRIAGIADQQLETACRATAPDNFEPSNHDCGVTQP